MCLALALALEDISAFVDVLNERRVLDSFCVLICFVVLFFFLSPSLLSSPFNLSRGKRKKLLQCCLLQRPFLRARWTAQGS